MRKCLKCKAEMNFLTREGNVEYVICFDCEVEQEFAPKKTMTTYEEEMDNEFKWNLYLHGWDDK